MVMMSIVRAACLLQLVGASFDETSTCRSYWFFKLCTDSRGQASSAEPKARGLVKLPTPPRVDAFRFDVNKMKDLAKAGKLRTSTEEFYRMLPDNAIQRAEELALNNGLFEPAECVGATADRCLRGSTNPKPQGFGDYGNGTDASDSCYAISGQTCTQAEQEKRAYCAAGKRFETLCAAKTAGFAGCEHLVTPMPASGCAPADAKADLSVAAIDPQYSALLAGTSLIDKYLQIDFSWIKYIVWDGPWIYWPLDRTCRHEYRHYATKAKDDANSPNPVQRFEFVGSTPTGGDTKNPACDVEPSNVCTSGYVLRRCEPSCDNLGSAASEMRDTSVQAYKFFSSSMHKQHVLANVDGDTVPGQQIVVAEWTNEDAGICGEAEHMRGFGGGSADPNLAWTNWYVYSSSGGTIQNGRMLVHAFPHTLSLDSGINLKTELRSQVLSALNAQSPDTSNSVSVSITSFNGLTVKLTSVMEFPWYTFLPDVTIKMTVKVRLYHHGTKLQVVVPFTQWSWSAGGLGLPNGVADDVSQGAQDAIDVLKVELAEGIRDTIVEALGGAGSLLDASFATFAFFDLDGTVASLINL